jgi:predicted esterase
VTENGINGGRSVRVSSPTCTCWRSAPRLVEVALAVVFCVLAAGRSPAQSLDDADKLLRKFEGQVIQLLVKSQPPLFERHLKSLRAMARSQYAVLSLEQASYLRRPLATHLKEFHDYLAKVSAGLDGDAADADSFLKSGNRPLVLARASQIDGTLQHFMVDLPPHWDPDRAYPLYVSLHGTGPDHPMAYPSFGLGPRDNAPKKSAEDPIIRLAPWGRGNRGWRNDAERDLFEAIADLRTFAKLDPDRWYLTGHSAGGDGAWSIVTRTPDLWAAAGMQSGSMQSCPPSLGLLANMQYVPFHMLIGEKDNLPGRIPDSKEAHHLLKQAGDETHLHVLPDVGHYPLPGSAYLEEEAWLRKFVRRRPDRFSFTVDQADHPGVWGVRVAFRTRGPRILKAPWPHFDVTITGSDVLVKTQAIERLTVDLGDTGLRIAGKVKLTINGKVAYEGEPKASPLSFDL